MRFSGRHKRVLIDTNVWIYHFEKHPDFGPAAAKVIESIEAGRIHAVASELMLMELIVRPLQLRRQDIADEYELILREFPHLELVPINREILVDAASLRARHRLRAPDAIQLATGLRSGATLAVTNDAAWTDLSGINTALLIDLTR